MTRLLTRYLKPYTKQIVLVVTLVLLQAVANLYLPDLNADIINNGVAKGDLHHILITGGFMLLVTFALAVTSVVSVYFGSRLSQIPPGRQERARPLATAARPSPSGARLDSAVYGARVTR